MKKTLSLIVVFATFFGEMAQGELIVGTAGQNFSQNFDSLSSTTGTGITWQNDTTLDGWYLFNSANLAVPTYRASTGTDTTGSFFSYGTSAADRALGGQGSNGAYFGSPAAGAVAGYIAVAFRNQTGVNLDSFTVGFDGEQWRNAGNTASQTMVFEYGFGNSFTSVSSWIAPGASYNWASSVNTSTAAAVNGNVAGLSANRGGTLTGLTWANNQTLWLRWVERNDAGNDHGLAIDNFSFSAVPEPTSLLMLGVAVSGLALRRRRFV